MTFIDHLSAGLLCGSFVAGTFVALDAGIGSKKGFLVEVCAIGLAVLFGTLLLVFSANGPAASFIQRFGAVCKVVFVAFALVSIVKLSAHYLRRETIAVSDLFRAMVGAAALMFATTSIDRLFYESEVSVSSQLSNVAMLTISAAIFLATPWAMRSSRRERNGAIVFSAGLLMVVFCRLLSSVIEHSSWITTMGLARRLPTGQANLLFASTYTLALMFAVPSMRYWARNTFWWAKLSLTISAWRFSWGKPQPLMRMSTAMKLWEFRDGVCFLNHGSFGAVPTLVHLTQRRLHDRINAQPMDELVRHFEPRWRQTQQHLAAWLGTKAENIALCENATAGMNEIASWFPLESHDEVLLNDHEYGAVRRIWQRRCERSGATLQTAVLPRDLHDPQQIVDAIIDRCNDRTRLVVVSHITSPTAIVMPVASICQRLNERGIASCIDGPHALLQEDLNLQRLGCDFYTASCHKWLCAPLGSGFTYIAPKWHSQVEPARLSWGLLQPKLPSRWDDELLWTGSRDSTPLLCIPAAIRFFEYFSHEQLDQRNHALASFAREQLLQLPGTQPVTPPGRRWFAWMVAVWLPAGDHANLQKVLWEKYQIEVPISRLEDRFLIRVSCHLYNTPKDFDLLMRALRKELLAK
ncbi:MAG: aminotransferase class V-fold PLP-dependent enzyme [Planctomycetales bacterium]|nr:aminotransferase class V-fold PLP-dependent enzyme [Planctomycetales bacterium]